MHQLQRLGITSDQTSSTTRPKQEWKRNKEYQESYTRHVFSKYLQCTVFCDTGYARYTTQEPLQIMILLHYNFFKFSKPRLKHYETNYDIATCIALIVKPRSQ
jgi:hypothetical protein